MKKGYSGNAVTLLYFFCDTWCVYFRIEARFAGRRFRFPLRAREPRNRLWLFRTSFKWKKPIHTKPAITRPISSVTKIAIVKRFQRLIELDTWIDNFKNRKGFFACRHLPRDFLTPAKSNKCSSYWRHDRDLSFADICFIGSYQR